MVPFDLELINNINTDESTELLLFPIGTYLKKNCLTYRYIQLANGEFGWRPENQLTKSMRRQIGDALMKRLSEENKWLTNYPTKP